MTTRTSRGQRIIQGKRTKGQSNPSNAYKSAQVAAAQIWPVFRSASGFIRQLFKGIPTGSTHAAEFYKYAYDNAFVPDGMGSGTFTVTDVIFAKGTMSPTAILTGTATAAGTHVNLTWDPANSDASQQATDVPWYVIRNLETGHTISGSIGVVRSAGASGNIATPAGFMTAGQHVSVWLNFVSDVVPVLDTNVSVSQQDTITVGA